VESHGFEPCFAPLDRGILSRRRPSKGYKDPEMAVSPACHRSVGLIGCRQNVRFGSR